MTDEVKTTEQARAELTGKIELPAPQKISPILDPAGVLSQPGIVIAPGAIKQLVDIVISQAVVNTDGSPLTTEQAAETSEGLMDIIETSKSLDAKAFADALIAAEPAETFANEPEVDVDKAFKFFTDAELASQGITVIGQVQDEVIVTVVPLSEVLVKPNALGTHEFCPMKDKCNHKGADYCKQAKLEADHKLECSMGNACDCFHASRGIPSVFRSKRTGS